MLSKIAALAVITTCALSALAPLPATAQTYEVLVGKQCAACGKAVPLSSRVGQRCPHCGVIWGYESKKYGGKREHPHANTKTPRQPATASTHAPQHPARPAPPAAQSSAQTRAWKQAVLDQASEVNPRVRGQMAPSRPCVHIEVRGKVSATSTRAAATPSDDMLRDSDAVLRSSRGAPVRTRQLALWIVRHPHASRADIPSAYGAGVERDDLLKQARALIIAAGLSPQRYRAFDLGNNHKGG